MNDEDKKCVVIVLILMALLIGFIIQIIHASYIEPNQACQRCGYNSATSADSMFGLKAECDGEHIIEYERSYTVTNKWGYADTIIGMRVRCNPNESWIFSKESKT